MVWGRIWRFIRLMAARRPVGRKTLSRPTVLFRDPGSGDDEQGSRLVGGAFRFDRILYRLPFEALWSGVQGRKVLLTWPPEVRRWLYCFDWLRDLQALGTNEARLTARILIRAWAEKAPDDPLAREAVVIGRRLANWLGHYAFCLNTAPEATQRRVMNTIRHDGRILAACLPLEPCGWEGLAALRGLLAVSMADPEQDGLSVRFQRYLLPELERLILDDGTVAERSPEAQFQTVRELVSLGLMCAALRLSPPQALQMGLEKTCAVLRAMCHRDGGLALFNGSSERQASEIQALLDRAERYQVITPVLPYGGFTRITLGRSLLLVDSAAPPERCFDRYAHAGTLSFEFSHHMHRLFVNSGAALTGTWREAFRGSAAHNVLVLDGESSSGFGADGHMTHRPMHVTCTHQATPEAHWLDLSHDGYHESFGAIWQRSLYLGNDGEDLRGREEIDTEREAHCVVRFHIHPDVRVEQEEEDVILYAGEEIWRFRQLGGQMQLEESLYLGRGQAEKSRQIVVSAQLADHETDPVGRRHYRQQISWVLERVPD